MKTLIENQVHFTEINPEIAIEFAEVINEIHNRTFEELKNLEYDYNYFAFYKGGSHIAVHQRTHKESKDWFNRIIFITE